MPRNWLKRELASLALTSADLLIGVDGGAEACLRAGHRPGLAVGDWDSACAGRAPAARARIRLPRTKDRSDLFFALEAARLAGARAVIALGVTAGRPDHHLAALLDLAQAAGDRRARFTRVQARGPEAAYHFITRRQGSWRGTLRKGHVLSIFAPLGDARDISLAGLRYSGRIARLVPSSHGLSNVARGGQVVISCGRGLVLALIPEA